MERTVVQKHGESRYTERILRLAPAFSPSFMCEGAGVGERCEALVGATLASEKGLTVSFGAIAAKYWFKAGYPVTVHADRRWNILMFKYN